MPAETPATLLICAANPADQPQLSLDLEAREIQNALRRSRKPFQIAYQWATRGADLRTALLDHKPDYVHFCGHGAGEAGLVLEGQFAHGDALAGLFKLFVKELKCVVLNACFSVVQARAIAEHVPFVVGMNKAIGDIAAIEFSKAFYEALGAGESIRFAFDLGCNAIQLAGIPEHLTPELITRQNLSDETSRSPLDRSLRQDWDGAPAVSLLYGRAADAELLRSWILGEACRAVLITGLRGMGKTDLASCLGRGGNRSTDTSATLATGIRNQFECVMWRSLLNAPPPEDLFLDMVGFLSDHRRAPGRSPEQQVENVLACLQERRCLIILDNVESILTASDPAVHYQQGYEAYGAFFEQVARTTHQSCLLLTSREKPRNVANLEGIQRPVRSLVLNGIGVGESQSLFAEIGVFVGTVDEWSKLVGLYAGNPLALELAARHIQEVFSGRIDAFLNFCSPVFSEIEELVDWHLDRLSPQETELVEWFAIERQPVSIAMLYDDLVSPASRQQLTSTLQRLRQRMPLELTIKDHFTLQPVLIERVTRRLVNKVVSSLAETLRDITQPSSGPSVIRALQQLDAYALMKATARENVRGHQRRLILAPVAESLSVLGRRDVRSLFSQLLDLWRRDGNRDGGYLVANIIHLLAHLSVELTGFDFSDLPVWQACLHDVNLRSTNFAFSAFRHTALRQPFGAVYSLCYSPDGASIANGDDNGEVRLFSIVTGQLEVRYIGHSDVVWAVAFTSQGHMLASASFDNTIRLWSTRDGRCIGILLGHEGWVYSLSFTPDGQTLASASEDGTCRIWHIASGTVKSVIRHPSFVAAACFSPNGQMLAVTRGTVVALFHAADLEHPVALLQHGGRVRSLAFSAQGDMLACGAEDHNVKLWRPTDGAHLATLAGHTEGVSSVSFSASGDVLASASMDSTVRLWSTARKQSVGQLYVAPARVWSVACSPSARTLVTGSEDGAARIWDMDAGECTTTLRGYSNKTWSLAFASNPRVLIAGNDDRLVRAWDIDIAQTKLELHGHASRVWAVASSPDGRWLASASDDGTVRVWDARSGAARHVLLGHTDWIRSVAFHPLLGLLASAGEDGKIFVWDVVSGARVIAIKGAMERVFSIAFCEGGKYLAAGGAAQNVALFSTDDGSRLGELIGHHGRINDVVALGGSDVGLASCSEDGTVKFWNVATRRCTGTVAVGCKVWCGAFCERGESFVSGGEDGVLRRSTLRSQTCDAEVTAHQGPVLTMAANATGDAIATSGNEGSIRLWRLPDFAPSPSPNILRPERPYEGMNISGATGLSASQQEALLALGAIAMPSS